MQYVVALGIALVLNACENLLMRAGMAKIGESGGVLKDGFPGAVSLVLTNPVLLIGLACFGLNAAWYMFALQSPALKISIAYPIMVGGGYAIIATIAYFFMAERMSPVQWIGVSLVLTGVLIIAIWTPAVTTATDAM